jgi:hypothetical protein
LEAGHFIFSDHVFNADLNKPILSHLKSIQDTCGPKSKAVCQNWDSDKEDKQKDIWQEVQKKCIAFNSLPIVPPKSAMDEIEDLTRKMHGLDIADVTYTGCYTHLTGLAPTAAQAWPTPRLWCSVNNAMAQDPYHIFPYPLSHIPQTLRVTPPASSVEDLTL